MKIKAHLLNKQEYITNHINVAALSANQRDNNINISSNPNYFTLYSYIKKNLVPLYIEEILFDDFVVALHNLDMIAFGNIISGKMSIDMSPYPKIDRDLSKLIGNGGLVPNLAFLNVSVPALTGQNTIKALSNFDLINGLYLKVKGNHNITSDNIYYPCKYYYKSNDLSKEIELHIQYVTKNEKL